VSHMVIFKTPDGNPGYNQFEELDEAVSFVESLRNEQGVENARMFALEEVKFEFKQYFRVAIDPPMVGAGATRSTPAAVGSPPAPPAFVPAPSQTAPDSYSRPEPVFTPPAPSAPSYADSSTSPVGSEPAVGAVPPPTFMAPPAPGSDEDAATGRRGLFGR